MVPVPEKAERAADRSRSLIASDEPRGPRRAAAIDIGSNTVKFTAAEVHTDGRVVPLREGATVTRLSALRAPGEALAPEAVERTIAALSEMLAAIRALGIDDVRAVATAGLRRAKDPDVFIGRARRELGLNVQMIDGRTEASLSFSGATSGPFGDGGVVIDIGGRSTELAVGRDGRMERFASLDVGTISLTEAYLPSDPPSTRELEACRAAARAHLGAAPEAPDDAPLIGVSGTVLALAGRARGVDRMEALIPIVEDAPLTATEVDRQIDELAPQPAGQRVLGDVIPEGRADVIVSGAILLREIMRRYARPRLHVTARGLRHGLLRSDRSDLG